MRYKEKAYYFLISFFCFVIHTVYAQDQKVADSLNKLYQNDNLNDSVKFELLRNIAFNETNDNILAIHYADELIKLSEQKGNNLYLHRGYFLKGNHQKLLGNLEEALASYFKSGEAAKKANYSKKLFELIKFFPH